MKKYKIATVIILTMVLLSSIKADNFFLEANIGGPLNINIISNDQLKDPLKEPADLVIVIPKDTKQIAATLIAGYAFTAIKDSKFDYDLGLEIEYNTPLNYSYSYIGDVYDEVFGEVKDASKVTKFKKYRQLGFLITQALYYNVSSHFSVFAKASFGVVKTRLFQHSISVNNLDDPIVVFGIALGFVDARLRVTTDSDLKKVGAAYKLGGGVRYTINAQNSVILTYTYNATAQIKGNMKIVTNKEYTGKDGNFKSYEEVSFKSSMYHITVGYRFAF